MVASEPDIVTAGEAANGVEAVEAFQRVHPDVTLLDLQMPIMGGLEALARIRDKAPNARVIVLTTYEGDAQAVRAVKAGASGYPLKSALRKQLIDAIRKVHAGRPYVLAEVAEEIAIHAAEEPLSGREVTVLRLVALGKANKAIAHELSLAEETVKAHLKHFFQARRH